MNVPVLRTLAIAVSAAVLVLAAPPARKKPAAPVANKQQAVVDPSKPFPVESIHVDGNKQFSDEEIVKMSGIQPGQSVQKADFDAAQKRLLDSGLFETVAYRYAPAGNKGGYAATFEVKEIGQAFTYRFEAIDIPDAELRAYLKQREPLFADRIPATEPVLKRFTSDLETFLTTRNKPLKIVGKLTPDPKGQLEVVFQPAALPAVAQVRFVGNRAIATPALQQSIVGAGIGALYTEPRFRQILDASIRPQYEQLGYMRVAFPKIETTPASDVKGVNVTVHITEGSVFKLREVNITGEMADNPRLAKEGAFRINETVDMQAIDQGAKRIEKYLKRRGFMDAAAKVQPKVDDKSKTVDVAIAVDPGPQYRMGKLDIEGLDITSEPQIRKMWALAEKAPFDFDYPDSFLAEMPNVLDNLGRTRSTIKPDPGTLTVDVILTFSPGERNPGGPGKRRREGGGRGGSVEFPFAAHVRSTT